MSTGSLGAIGSVVTGQLQQTRQADGERLGQDLAGRSRAESSQRQAEAAAGIGEMEQDGATSERDADGRRLWERPLNAPQAQDGDSAGLDESPRSRDADGISGNQLDLDG